MSGLARHMLVHAARTRYIRNDLSGDPSKNPVSGRADASIPCHNFDDGVLTEKKELHSDRRENLDS